MLTHKILDVTLESISSVAANDPQPYSRIFSDKHELKDISPRDQKSILDKLKKDGYVSTVPHDPILHATIPYAHELYFISFEGLMLLQDGGYVTKRRKERISTTLELIETWVIAVAALLAAIFSAVPLFRNGK